MVPSGRELGNSRYTLSKWLKFHLVLVLKIVNIFTKTSDIADPPMAERERATANRAAARIWLAAQPPCENKSHER